MTTSTAPFVTRGREGQYNCRACGHLCHDKGGDAEHLNLCETCYELNIEDGQLSHNGGLDSPVAEVRALLKALDAQAGAGKAAAIFPALCAAAFATDDPLADLLALHSERYVRDAARQADESGEPMTVYRADLSGRHIVARAKYIAGRIDKGFRLTVLPANYFAA